MKRTLLILFLILPCWMLMAQQEKIYNPDADAKKEIKEAVKNASKTGKHVFLQIGGNWCSWCIKFHKFVSDDMELKSFLETNFEVVKVNYDPKNKNEKVLADLGFPQRFGFPVFVILDSKGNRIHTQNTGYLELDKGYDKRKVLEFFKHWSPTALDPESYKAKEKAQ